MPNTSSSGQSRQETSPRQNVEQKANQVTQQVAEKAQSTFENARAKVAEQFSAVARAIESAADTLQQHDQGGLSQRVKKFVQKAEQSSRYLRDKSPQQLKNDLDGFARKRPAWFLGGAVVLGMLAARFLKSSERKDSVEYARAQ